MEGVRDIIRSYVIGFLCFLQFALLATISLRGYEIVDNLVIDYLVAAKARRDYESVVRVRIGCEYSP